MYTIFKNNNMNINLFKYCLITIFLSHTSIQAQVFNKVLTGPIANDGGSSYGSAWIDFNHDNFIDLFKDGWEDSFITHGNYYAPNQFNTLFKNNQLGSFTQIPGGVASSDTGN